MALSIVSRIGASPLGRAGVAIFSILALAGVVQFGLPMACAAGAAFCRGEATLDAALGPVEPALAETIVAGDGTGGDPAAGPGLDASPEAAVTQVAIADIELPTISNNDLIATTFAALDVELAAQPAELTSRTVRTVAINADGSPAGLETEAPAPLVAEAPLDGSQESSAASASSEPMSSEPEVQVAEASAEATPAAASEGDGEPSLAYAPASGDVASVTGKGANVRSLPQRGGSDVLFALRGGEEVTIVEMRRGWAKVVDQQGRSGWIYGVYLKR